MSRQAFLRWFVVMSLFATGLTSVFVLATADAKPKSIAVHGVIFSEPVTGPGCTSPIGFCARGTFNGGISGPFEGTALRLTPSLTPGLFFLDSNVVVHTREGDLFLADANAIDLTPGGAGARVVLSKITGNRGWAGATGYLEVMGGIVTEPGSQTLYRGRITVP